MLKVTFPAQAGMALVAIIGSVIQAMVSCVVPVEYSPSTGVVLSGLLATVVVVG